TGELESVREDDRLAIVAADRPFDLVVRRTLLERISNFARRIVFFLGREKRLNDRIGRTFSNDVRLRVDAANRRLLRIAINAILSRFEPAIHERIPAHASWASASANRHPST
ncbi:MAG TPA: hypothetical protein VHR72_09370, partial [Gemmataceae bacterium]|nr:hypothetical protein [Gemmataceae bacterium]